MAAPVSIYLFYPNGGSTNGWDLRKLISWYEIPTDTGVPVTHVRAQFQGMGSPDARAQMPKAAFLAAVAAAFPASQIFYPDVGQLNGWMLDKVISWYDLPPDTGGPATQLRVMFSGIGSNDQRVMFDKAAFEAAYQAYLTAIAPVPPSPGDMDFQQPGNPSVVLVSTFP